MTTDSMLVTTNEAAPHYIHHDVSVCHCHYSMTCHTELHNYRRSMLCMCKWFFRAPLRANVWLQTPQLYGRSAGRTYWSPSCVRWCIFRALATMNELLQISQTYGRSPVCKRWCFFRSLLWVKELLQVSQAYGRSPVCMRRCAFRALLTVNELLQTSQVYGRSPVCMRRCAFRALLTVNDLLQISQVYGRTPVCMRWCFFR